MDDINISYRDMGHVGGRVNQLRAEIKKSVSLIDRFMAVLAEKKEMLRADHGENVQLECEIYSVEHKLMELEGRKNAQQKAAECCSMYGIFGMDYSVSADRMYYMGKPVRYFSDPGGSGHDWDGSTEPYKDQQGVVSVTAVRGSTGQVLYLKVYDYKK